MKKFILPALLVLLIATGCGRKVVYNETRQFANNTWKFFEPETFDVNIKNIDNCYNIYVELVIDTAYLRESNYPILINMYSPNNERRTFRSYVMVRNEQGSWLGDLDGKYLKCKDQIREYFFFNVEGKHQIQLSHLTGRYEQPGIQSLTLSIEKAKLEYPE